MNPAAIALLTSLLGLVQQMGSLKAISLLFIVGFGPDILFIVMICVILNKFDLTVKEMRRQHANFEAKYDNNALLVKQVVRLAEGAQDVVVLNTQTMQKVADAVDKNAFCPMMRKDAKVEVRL